MKKVKGKVISPEKFYEDWRKKKLPVKRGKDWGKFKWRVCEEGERVNPILHSTGGEIEVEQFGIVGWLFKVRRGDVEKKEFFYQCALIDSRQKGTGKFGEWLVSVKKFVREEFGCEFALTNITNQGLYKYCRRHNISVAVDYVLYKVGEKKK